MLLSIGGRLVFERKACAWFFFGRFLPELCLLLLGFEFAVGKQKNWIVFSSALFALGEQTAYDEFAQPAEWVAGDLGFCLL